MVEALRRQGHDVQRIQVSVPEASFLEKLCRFEAYCRCIDPGYASAFYNRGIAWRRKGDLDRAIADYDQAIKLNPRFSVAFNNRGNAFDDKGDAKPGTRDGGVTWTPVTAEGIDKVPGICGIHILPVRRIFQGEMRTSHIIHAAGRVGGPAMVLRSEDDGESWRVIDLSAQAGMILDVAFLSPKTGFVCTATPSETGAGEAQILRTDDGGKSWQIGRAHV